MRRLRLLAWAVVVVVVVAALLAIIPRERRNFALLKDPETGAIRATVVLGAGESLPKPGEKPVGGELSPEEKLRRELLGLRNEIWLLVRGLNAHSEQIGELQGELRRVRRGQTRLHQKLRLLEAGHAAPQPDFTIPPRVAGTGGNEGLSRGDPGG